jgi:crossover junction endodeoxyribonuclease RuvC
MIILGIDPGTATTGYGVIELLNGNLKLVDFGCILTKSNEKLEYRLEKIHQELNDLIKRFSPNEVVVEELFFTNNAKTAIAVGQARGVIILTARMNNCPVFEYTPLQVKNAVCGYGGAEKSQVQKMVKLLLRLDIIPKPDDAADAVAIAICHAHSRKINSLR